LLRAAVVFNSCTIAFHCIPSKVVNGQRLTSLGDAACTAAAYMPSHSFCTHMPKSRRIEAGLLRAAVVFNSCTIAFYCIPSKVVNGQRLTSLGDAARTAAAYMPSHSFCTHTPKSKRIEAGLLRAAVVFNSCTIAFHCISSKVVNGQRLTSLGDAARTAAAYMPSHSFCTHMPKSKRIEAGLLRAAVVFNSCTIAFHCIPSKVMNGQRLTSLGDAACTAAAYMPSHLFCTHIPKF
jgi:HAMP domain-containing protein